MDYLELIQKFFEKPEHSSLKNFFETMYCLISNLKKHGLTRDDINPNLIGEIANGFLNKNVKEVYKVKFGYYLLYYLDFLIDLDYDYENTEKFDKIITKEIGKELKKVNEVKSIDNLKPSDFKSKKYDSDFLNLIGANGDCD